MTLFAVRIVQVYQARREIVVFVDANDMESAVEQVSGEEAPAFDDPDWETSWDLQCEVVSPGDPIS